MYLEYNVLIMFVYCFILFHSFGTILSRAHKVGITATKLHSETWAIIHHTLSMYESMTHIEGWDPVLVIRSDDYKTPTETIRNVTYNAISLDDCAQLDTLVQSARIIDPEKCPGVHQVYFNQGATYFNVVQDVFANVRRWSTTGRDKFDSIWTAPHYQWQGQFLKYWYGRSHSRVYDAPYVWTSRVMESRFVGFRYVPGTANRVGVYETNRGVQKVSLVPMMVVEVANQATAIDYAQIYGVGNFHTSVFETDILSRMKVRWSGSKKFGDLPERWDHSRIGTVVSHTLLNGLNNLWLEALHAGMALVHNSEHMRECGYYYDGFNVTDGAEALKRAIATHDADEDRKVRDQACLWRFSPENPANIAWYKRLLDRTLTPTTKHIL